MVMHQREFTKRSPASTPVPSPYLALHPHALTSKPDITGPHGATTAIIDIYDIFGFSPQTIQGADILSTRLNALVLLPDFFHGDGAKHEWLPADTEEKMSALMGFVESKADFKTNLCVLGEVVKVYRETFSGVKTWGALGLCWGGKVSFLFSFFGCWLGDDCADVFGRLLSWLRGRGRRLLLLHRFIRGRLFDFHRFVSYNTNKVVQPS